MATNIDKALFQQPMGIEELSRGEDPIEIEIIDPEEVKINLGDLQIEIEKAEPSIDDFGANLAEFIDDGELSSLASQLSEDIDNDKNARKEWEKAYVTGLKLLGLQIEERTEPWDGASGVFHPMITEAGVRFQSETITETFPASGPVRTKIRGKQTPEKQEAAARVEADMNYQLTDEMVEFRPEHERMLWSLPATGSAFKKVYYDPNQGRQVSIFIPAEDIVLPYGTSNIQTCYRVTHVMRKTENEIKKLQQAGFYRDVDIGQPDKAIDEINKAKDKETGFADINDDRFTLYESHVDLYIKGDPLADEDDIMLPYVFTFIKGTNTVLAIRRNWSEDDELHLKRQHFVHYQYIPGFGAYGFGLFHLIGGFANSATSLMRQLIDAGTLSNLPGGLKTRGLRIKGDDTPIAPGEFRDADVGAGTLRDNILPLPYKEPSATLYNLLNTVVEEGRRFAATADMKVSDMSAQAPVGTTLALLERQLKVLTAVQARVHYALKEELKLIRDIIRDYSEEDYAYEPDRGSPRAKKSDYDDVDVIPVSDPNAATLSQRVVQYQAVIQLSQTAPDIYDLPKLHRGMLEVLGVKDADKLVPLPEDMKPKDPVSENQNLLKGEPAKAFLYQDHQSHIQVHMSMMQDPSISQLIGQSPNAQKIQAALMAHVVEHVGFSYRQQIEQQLGAALPPEDADLPPHVEEALSSMMARAAQQVMMQNQAQAQQQQAQQQQQDPIVQMQQQELQIKQQELQLKQAEVQGKLQLAQTEVQGKLQLAQAELQLKTQQVQQQAQQAQQEHQLSATKLSIDGTYKSDQLELQEAELQARMELDAMRVGAQVEKDKAKLMADQEREGVRMGVEIAKARQQSRTPRKPTNER